jgi:hypothetical protein
MKRNPEEIKLIKDWLSFAEENLLLAHSGMNEEFSPYHMNILRLDATPAI